MRRSTTAVTLSLGFLLDASALFAQCGSEETFIPDPTVQPLDQFGTTVARAGRVLVVGAIQYDGGYYGYYPGPGYVRVFRFDGVQWNHEQSFTNPQPIIGSLFGSAVATNGAWIVASAKYYHDKIWFFQWDGASWVERQSFEGSTGQYYGHRLAMDGEWAAAVDPSAGSVDVYRLVHGSWKLAQKLKHDGGIFHVAIDGARILTAQPSAALGTQLSTWVHDGFAWRLEQDFGPFDPNADGGSLFGRSISISGDWAVAGMPWDSTGAQAAGSVYVYQRVNGTWTLDEHLQEPGGPGALHYFGFSVATDGERIVALKPAYYVRQGVASVYRRGAAGWELEIELMNRNGYFDGFGESISLEGSKLVVGAPAAISRDGGAYLFQMNDLTLQATPKLAPPFTPVEFITCKGVPGTPALLAAIAVNGTPTFVGLSQGVFDASGQWSLLATVPPGLSGLVVTCVTFGQADAGRLERTNRQNIALQ